MLTAALVAAITCASAKPGKGNGGGGDPEPPPPGEEVVPWVATPPVTYTTTPIVWHDAAAFNNPGFQGIYVDGINLLGITVGCALLPPEVPGENGERRAGACVLVDEDHQIVFDASGNMTATDTMVDLNLIFEDALSAFNADRATNYGDGPWRLAYARKISGDAKVICTMIPQSEAMNFDSVAAYYAEREPVPLLFVLADLPTGQLLAVEPENSSPDQDVTQMNENGDLLIRHSDNLFEVDWNHSRLFILDLANGVYVEEPVGGLDDDHSRMNSSLEILRIRYTSESEILNRYSVLDQTDTDLWERENGLPWGIAEDGSVYANSDYLETYRKGPIKSKMLRIPHHVHWDESSMSYVATPITDTNASAASIWDCPSHAATSGEEEAILRIHETNEYQVYKPAFGARFTLEDIPPNAVCFIRISPPADNSANSDPYTVSSGSYQAGYIAWYDRNYDAYIMTPQGAPPIQVLPGAN